MGDLINKNMGKYVKKGVLEPIGYCARTGFPFSHSDLVKEYDAFGNTTNLLIGKPFVDKPNPQSLPPRTCDDPRPVKNPMPWRGTRIARTPDEIRRQMRDQY